MAESKMPARIWARDLDGAGSMHPCAKGDPGAIDFVPADIVEPLVEALRKAEELYQVGLLNASDGLANEVVALRRAALQAYEAAQ